MISAGEIERLIRQSLPDARVTLRDLTGGGDHWEAVVVSGAFAGKTLVEQHQLVYAALREQMSGPIHALQLRTLAPDRASDPR
jgi:stress-induced morphogen